MRISLQLRLILILTGLFLSCVSISAVWVIYSGERTIAKDYDSQLIADANVLWHMLREDLSEGDKIGEVTMQSASPDLRIEQLIALNTYTKWRAFRIWRHKRLVAWTPAPELPQEPQTAAGFTEKEIGAAHWRVYTLFDPASDLTIEAWENLANRATLRHTILDDLALPALGLLPLMVLLLMGAVKVVLGDLRHLTSAIEKRDAESLEPLDCSFSRAPKEIRPLVSALNALLDRLRQGQARERELIDNTAHELRTPLAVLKLQADLLERATTEDERRDGLADLKAGIERACKLSEQVLLLAQIHQGDMPSLPFNLEPIVQDLIASRALIAHEKAIDLQMDGQPVAASGNPELFSILVAILLDNALKYTPSGGAVTVRLEPTGVSVIDTGKGIAAADRAKVFERFSRLDRSQAGTGLGLSIAQEICTAHRWQIELSDGVDGVGLCVRVRMT